MYLNVLPFQNAIGHGSSSDLAVVGFVVVWSWSLIEKSVSAVNGKRGKKIIECLQLWLL